MHIIAMLIFLWSTGYVFVRHDSVTAICMQSLLEWKDSQQSASSVAEASKEEVQADKTSHSADADAGQSAKSQTGSPCDVRHHHLAARNT